MTTPVPTTTHTPVMMAPIGKIKILVPGSTKMVLVAVAAVDDVVATVAVVLVVPVVSFADKAPTRNAACLEFRVELKAAAPEAVIAVKVTVGRTAASYWSVVMFDVIAALLMKPLKAYV